jgi:hypothetical protein
MTGMVMNPNRSSSIAEQGTSTEQLPLGRFGKRWSSV